MRNIKNSHTSAGATNFKRLQKFLKQTKQLEQSAAAEAHEYKVISGKDLSPAMLAQAKRLHAAIYLEIAFIDPADIGPEGIMHVSADPHQQHSDYFVVIDKREPGKVLATARQIRAEAGHHQLPIFEKSKLYTRGRSKVLQVEPQYIVEISGLVKAHGTSSSAVLELYLAMWGDSMRRGHKVWIMAVDVKLYRRLKILFGTSITRIGRRTHYKGGDVIPCKLELNESHIKLLKNLDSRHPLFGKARRAMANKFLRAYSELQAS